MLKLSVLASKPAASVFFSLQVKNNSKRKICLGVRLRSARRAVSQCVTAISEFRNSNRSAPRNQAPLFINWRRAIKARTGDGCRAALQPYRASRFADGVPSAACSVSIVGLLEPELR
jgi:hypothetical protein